MKVLIIFGGRSTEYSVSCVSAASVIRNINNHDIVKIGITRDGLWYKTSANADQIEKDEWKDLPENEEIKISFNTKEFIYKSGSFSPDVIFPVLHGKNGEDGTIQGLFELMGIPYVGCRVLGSAICMDKAYTKIVFKNNGIKQVDWITIEKYDFLKNNDSVVKEIDQDLTYPVFVKPSNAGSSIGITKCNNSSDIISALQEAFKYDRRVVVESGVVNPKEVEVAVLGNDNPVSSVSGRICAANDFYDYDSKYKNSESKLYIPSGIDCESEIRNIAIQAYKACDCKGLARVDFLIDNNNNIYLNEINTIPGFTSISMYPKLFAASGVQYGELIDKLLEYAVEFSA